MKKNIYLGLFALIAVGIGLFFLIDIRKIVPETTDKKISQEEIKNEEKPIGGERDEYGCLGPAGYVYNEQIMGCIRNWELNDNQKGAAALAIQEVGQTVGLTIIEVSDGVDGVYEVTVQFPNTEQFLISVEYPQIIFKPDESEDISEAIAQALIEKNEWEEDGLIVSVSENDGAFAGGAVTFEGGETGGGGWYAAYVDGVWEIIWDGNGVIFCEDLEEFELTYKVEVPSSLIEECYDQVLETTIIR